MAWTVRAIIGFSFGVGAALASMACSDDSSSSNSSLTSTTGGGGEGTPIPFENGWVPAQEFGIQGSFYTFKDDMDTNNNGIVGTSMIMPDSFADAGTQVCASGSAGQVMNDAAGQPAYSDYWGTAVGLNLSQEEGNDMAYPYDAASNGVVGFSFTLAGDNPVPAEGELRFNIKVAGDDHNYCQPIIAAGNSTFMLKDMWQDCWNKDATAPTPDTTKLEALHWQYVTNVNATYSFDICITELRVITQ